MSPLFPKREAPPERDPKERNPSIDTPEAPEPEGVERESYLRRLIEDIRANSAGGRLTSLAALSTQFPPPAKLREDPDFSLPAAIAAIPDAADVREMKGSSDTWYYSETSMTGAYALHLLRREENDPLRLIADTVRDESRIYPRPTDLRFFSDPPFSMSARDLQQALGSMELRPDMADLRRSTASNGAVYLYSTRYLSEALADTLTEWIEVGQKENP
jgi:hypothetical protein